jgi:hypothetical protein
MVAAGEVLADMAANEEGAAESVMKPSGSRRAFVRQMALAAAALALPAPLRGDPYAPWPALRRAQRPIRIRGRVVAGGRGLRRVAVSDGLRVVATGADGRFEIVSDDTRRYVMISVPSGYRLPTHPSGTLRLFERLDRRRGDELDVLFELQPMPGGDERHGFLVLADPQTLDSEDMARLQTETVPAVRATVESMGDVPLFGVANGDIMYDDLTLYGDYEHAVARTGIPFAQVVGNHDLDLEQPSDEASTTTFQRHFGPPYYSFNRGRVHYVVLDDVFYHGQGYLGYITADQLTWLAADLALVERGAPVVVFLHIPLLSTRYARSGEARPPISNSVTNRDALARLLEPFRPRVIAGHTHELEHRRDGRLVEHIIGTTCGAWWTGDICYDGTPNGYMVFEVDGESFRWHYQATGRPAAYQIRLYPRGTDPRAPDEVVANVWNWDPDWTVTWHVNGDRRGLMARRRGSDPQSVREHAGPERPVKHPWVDPVPTDHLFYAPVGPDEGPVVVEARDPWGRVYVS